MSSTIKETCFHEKIDVKARSLVLNNIPEALKAIRSADELRFICFKDGQIIGTGESDFTRGNVVYECVYKNKSFQLLDVPGIEGNESKYEKDIEGAVAKAHLIFYVNGTNKKPEMETASRIKKYMRREALIYGICNVRGKADAYEFPEDQICIEKTHKDISSARDQTKEVLDSIMGDRLLGMDSIQGLLGFCSLAYNEHGVSTIDRNRKKDLIKAQHNYFGDFGDLQKMREFSRIDNLYELIDKKSESFQQDIYTINKLKILGTIKETLGQLQRTLKEYQVLHQEIEQEMTHCKRQLMKNLARSEEAMKTRVEITVDSFYSIIEMGISDIIKNNKQEEIKRLSELLIEAELDKFVEELGSIQEKVVNGYNAGNSKALERLKENIDRIDAKYVFRKNSIEDGILADVLARLKPDLKDIGKAAFSIGSYVLTGALLGSIIPGGPLVGAGIGAVLGIAMSIVQYVVSEEKKIRNAQNKLSEEIAKHKTGFQDELRKGVLLMINEMRDATNKIVEDLNKERSKMNDLKTVLEEVIRKMQEVKNEVEESPYEQI